MHSQGGIVSWDVGELNPKPRPFTGINLRLVEMIAREWNVRNCGVGLVNVRKTGFPFLLDGNHRREAMLIVGERTFPCETYYDLTADEENKLIHCRGRDIRPYRQLDDFGLSLETGENFAVEIMSLLNARGLSLVDRGGRGDPRKVGGIKILCKIYGLYGSEVLGEVLDLNSSWTTGDGDPMKWNSALMEGLAKVIAEDEVDVQRLLSKLMSVTPTWLMAKAREARVLGVSSISMGCRLALLNRYKARGRYGAHWNIDIQDSNKSLVA